MLRNLRIFLKRGLVKRQINFTWWAVPRCYNCNKLLWGSVRSVTTDDGVMWCWDCEIEHLSNPMLDLEAAFGKPTEGKANPNEMFYDWTQ